MQLQRGLQFAPGYRLQEFLGRGQFGQVWRASAPGGTSAAVKFIDLSDGQGEKEYDGIRRVKQIRQANLMPIIAIWLLDGEGRMIEEAPDEAVATIDFSKVDVSDQSGMVSMPQKEASWLVVAMLLGGQSLQHRLKECIAAGHRGIPPKELISLMDESAKGLDFLNSPIHDLGDGPIAIQHCDVKPANIVLIGNSAVVCDFGLARILTRSQATATSASGTPAYMAPEAIEGKPSCTSDQYSLAITYYQLRTGTLPVNEGSLWQVLDSHRQGKLNFELVPAEEQAVLRKATSMKWQDRFGSNVDMVDALREAIRVSGGSISASAGVGGNSSPATDQSRLTSPVAGTGGVTLPQRNIPSLSQTVQDPTATIDSQFLRSRENSAAATPAGLFGSPELLATMQIASPLESTKSSMTSAELAEATYVAGTTGAAAGSTTGDSTGRVLSELAKRPNVAIFGGGGVVLAGLLGGWMLFSGRPEPVVEPINGGGKGSGTGGTVVGTDEEVVEKADPAVLMSKALAQLQGNEEDAARSTYLEAITLDPSLDEVIPKVWTGHKRPVAAITIANQGKALVTLAEDSFACLWRLDAGSQESPTPVELKTENFVLDNAFALDPSGERLVTGEFGGSVYVWNLSTTDANSKLPLEGHDDDVLSTVWHPKGKYIVTACQTPKIGIWEIREATFENPNGSIVRKNLIDVTSTYELLAFDESGDNLVGMSIDGEVDKFKWDELIATFDTPASPSPVPVMAEGDTARRFELAKTQNDVTRVVVAGGSQVVSIWSLDSPVPDKIDSSKEQLPDMIESLQVTSIDDGYVIAAGTLDGTLTILNGGATVTTKSIKLGQQAISGIDISSDGKWIAVVADQGAVSMIHLGDGEPTYFSLPIEKGGGRSVLIDSQGRRLIAGTYDGSVCIWDLDRVKLRSLIPEIRPSKTPPKPDEKPESFTQQTVEGLPFST